MNIYGESAHSNSLTTQRLNINDGGTHPGAWISLRDPAVVDV